MHLSELCVQLKVRKRTKEKTYRRWKEGEINGIEEQQRAAATKPKVFFGERMKQTIFNQDQSVKVTTNTKNNKIGSRDFFKSEVNGKCGNVHETKYVRIHA